MLARPALRSRFRAARLVRISFARWSASMRWTRERSGAAVVGLAGVFVAGGMGGESTAPTAADRGGARNSCLPQVEVQADRAELTVSRAFAGLFLDAASRVRGSVQPVWPGALGEPAHPRAGPGRTRFRRQPDLRPHAVGRRRDVRTVPHPCRRWA